jgi:OTU domain-containing protein 6
MEDHEGFPDKNEDSTSNQLTVEECTAQYRKALKALEGEKLAALKHAKSSGGAKKAKKAQLAKLEMDFCAKESDLKQSHQEQLASLFQDDATTTNNNSNEDGPTSVKEDSGEATNNNDDGIKEDGMNNEQEQVDNDNNNELSQKEKNMAKARRKKMAKKEKERERELEIETERQSAGPSARAMEVMRMMELYLAPHELHIHDISSDGNCLYRAISHQLQQHQDTTTTTTMTFTKVRSLCADMLLQHRDDYEPFCEYHNDKVTSYEEYVEQVRHSSEWGGQLELRALAQGLQRTIVVYSADAAPLHMTPSSSNTNNDNDVLRVSFHRSYYALGEHYNSVIPQSSS